MTYTAQDIKILSEKDAVRLHPSMYLGDINTYEGVLQCLNEAIDNSLDEYFAGYCNEIYIEQTKDNEFIIEDNGRGIPVDIHPETKISTLTTILTKLHSGAKFSKELYKTSSGLHGVGISCVNFVSEEFQVFIARDNKLYYQKYIKGVKESEPIELGYTEKKQGTKIKYKLDKDIFKQITLDDKLIIERIKTLSYLNDSLKFIYKNPEGQIVEFIGRDNIKDFLNDIIEEPFSPIFYFKTKYNDTVVELVFQYGKKENIKSFVNNIETKDGGTHVIGFKNGLQKNIDKYKYLLNLKENYSTDIILKRLNLIIKILTPKTSFSGQTKSKLITPEIKDIVILVLDEMFGELYKTDKDKIINLLKIIEENKLLKEEKKNKTNYENLELNLSLTSCKNINTDKSELFIVEGISAGGCFCPKTKVLLTDLNYASFSYLSKFFTNKYKIFTYDINNFTILEAPLYAPIFNKLKPMIKLYFDYNNSEVRIICTPDHLFLQKNGKYIEAKDITPDTELFTFKDDIKLIKKDDNQILHIAYDLFVPQTNNYFIFPGLCVHNSTKQARDKKFQAVLPLQGKILNTEKNIFELKNNKELKILINSLGTGIGKNFSIKNLRYGKIICLMDADPDGGHIICLLLTFIYKYMRQLIEYEKVYIAYPPLYKIIYKNKEIFCYTLDELNYYINLDKTYTDIKYYKGLGEMNPNELKETVLDPKKRIIKKVVISDFEETEKTIKILMGKNIEVRKNFLLKNLEI